MESSYLTKSYLARNRILGCRSNAEICNGPLMPGRTIKLTASSVRQVPGEFHGPTRAILNAHEFTDRNGRLLAGAWSAAPNDSDPYIQVELEALSVVRGVITQGRNGCCQEWVTEYKILYSNAHDCSTWEQAIVGNGTIFHGNVDEDTTFQNNFQCSASIKCVRLVPVKWHNHPSLRFDLIGCPMARTRAALSLSGAITTNQTPNVSLSSQCSGSLLSQHPFTMTASSEFAPHDPKHDYGANRGILNTTEYTDGHGNVHIGAWVAENNDFNQYLQVELSKSSIIRGVVTQGRSGCCHQWVSRFRIQYSVDCKTWSTVGNGSAKVFEGNSNEDTPVTNIMNCPITAKCIRIVPSLWHTHIALRMDLLGCEIRKGGATVTGPSIHSLTSLASTATAFTETSISSTKRAATTTPPAKTTTIATSTVTSATTTKQTTNTTTITTKTTTAVRTAELTYATETSPTKPSIEPSKTCADKPGVDCFIMNQIGVCNDTLTAREYCPKFCGICPSPSSILFSHPYTASIAGTQQTDISALRMVVSLLLSTTPAHSESPSSSSMVTTVTASPYTICQDKPDVDCKLLNTAGVCHDHNLALKLCPKLCGLCTSLLSSATIPYVAVKSLINENSLHSVSSSQPNVMPSSTSVSPLASPIASALQTSFVTKSSAMPTLQAIPLSTHQSTISSFKFLSTSLPSTSLPMQPVCQDKHGLDCSVLNQSGVCHDPILASKYCPMYCGICLGKNSMSASMLVSNSASTSILQSYQQQSTPPLSTKPSALHTSQITSSIISTNSTTLTSPFLYSITSTRASTASGLASSVPLVISPTLTSKASMIIFSLAVASSISFSSVCVDMQGVDCIFLERSGVCHDIGLGQKYCPKYCGLCSTASLYGFSPSVLQLETILLSQSISPTPVILPFTTSSTLSSNIPNTLLSTVISTSAMTNSLFVCMDKPDVDCNLLNQIGVCQNANTAQTFCPRFCGLCQSLGITATISQANVSPTTYSQTQLTNVYAGTQSNIVFSTMSLPSSVSTSVSIQHPSTLAQYVTVPEPIISSQNFYISQAVTQIPITRVSTKQGSVAQSISLSSMPEVHTKSWSIISTPKAMYTSLTSLQPSTDSSMSPYSLLQNAHNSLSVSNLHFVSTVSLAKPPSSTHYALHLSSIMPSSKPRISVITLIQPSETMTSLQHSQQFSSQHLSVSQFSKTPFSPKQSSVLISNSTTTLSPWLPASLSSNMLTIRSHNFEFLSSRLMSISPYLWTPQSVSVTASSFFLPTSQFGSLPQTSTQPLASPDGRIKTSSQRLELPSTTMSSMPSLLSANFALLSQSLISSYVSISEKSSHQSISHFGITYTLSAQLLKSEFSSMPLSLSQQPTPFDSSNPTLSQVLTPVYSSNPTLSQQLTTFDSSNPTLSQLPTPVYSSNPTFSQQLTTFDSSNPTLPQLLTPVYSSNPTLSQQLTTFDSSNPTLSQLLTPVYGSNPTLSQQLTPFYSSNPTLSQQLTPFDSSNPTLSQLLTPVYSSNPTLSQQLTPVYSSNPTLSQLLTPVHSSNPTLSQLLTPFFSSNPTFSQLLTPVYSSNPTLSQQLTPLYGSSPTLSQLLTPVYSSNPTLSQLLTPFYSSNPTVSQLLTPVYSSNPTLSQQLTPLYGSSPTLSQLLTPVYSSNLTLSQLLTHFYSSNPTLSQQLTPLLSSNSTLSQLLTHFYNSNPTLSQPQTPIYNSNPTSSQQQTPFYNINPTLSQQLTPTYGSNPTLSQLTPFHSSDPTLSPQLTPASIISSTLSTQSTSFYSSNYTSTQLLTHFYNNNPTLSQHLTPTHSSNHTSSQQLSHSYISDPALSQHLTLLYSSNFTSSQYMTPFYNSNNTSSQQLTPFYSSNPISSLQPTPFYSSNPTFIQLTSSYSSSPTSMEQLTSFYNNNHILSQKLTHIYSSNPTSSKHLPLLYSSNPTSSQHITPLHNSNSTLSPLVTPFYSSKSTLAQLLTAIYSINPTSPQQLTPVYSSNPTSSQFLTPFYNSNPTSSQQLTPIYSNNPTLSQQVTTITNSDPTLLQQLTSPYNSYQTSSQQSTLASINPTLSQQLASFHSNIATSFHALTPRYNSNTILSQQMKPFHSSHPASSQMTHIYNNNPPASQQLTNVYNSNPISQQPTLLYSSNPTSLQLLTSFYSSNTMISQQVTPIYSSHSKSSQLLTPFYNNNRTSLQHLTPTYNSNPTWSQQITPIQSSNPTLSAQVTHFYSNNPTLSQQLVPFYNKTSTAFQNTTPHYNSNPTLSQQMTPIHSTHPALSPQLKSIYNSNPTSSQQLTPSYNSNPTSSQQLTPSYNSNTILSHFLTPFYSSSSHASSQQPSSFISVPTLTHVQVASSYDISLSSIPQMVMLMSTAPIQPKTPLHSSLSRQYHMSYQTGSVSLTVLQLLPLQSTSISTSSSNISAISPTTMPTSYLHPSSFPDSITTSLSQQMSITAAGSIATIASQSSIPLSISVSTTTTTTMTSAPCIDTSGFDCHTFDLYYGLCKNPVIAKSNCPKYCNLCP